MSSQELFVWWAGKFHWNGLFKYGRMVTGVGVVLAGTQGDRFKILTDKYKNDSLVVLFVLIRF